VRSEREVPDNWDGGSAGRSGTLRAATCPTKPAAISELLLIDFAKSEAAFQESLGAAPGAALGMAPKRVTH
jgi:hypothetical protein